MNINDVVDDLKKAGGGIVAVVVAKNGEFCQTVYQEAVLNDKKEVEEFFSQLPGSLLAFFNDDLSSK